jgi:hypothetical protein
MVLVYRFSTLSQFLISSVSMLMQLSSSSLNASNFTFLKADFFTWSPTELFDLVIDYT